MPSRTHDHLSLFLAGAVIVMVGAFVLRGAIAFGTNNPSILGHTVGEVDWSQDIPSSVGITGDLKVTGASTNFRSAITTVDGSGSGIDADLLDGLDSTAFLSAAGGPPVYYMRCSWQFCTTGEPVSCTIPSCLAGDTSLSTYCWYDVIGGPVCGTAPTPLRGRCERICQD